MEKRAYQRYIGKNLNSFYLKKIDFYIIKKFISTFFYAIGMIIVLAVVFDLSEKMDDFIENNVSIKEVIFDYYINFAPSFAVLFSALFTFISVIYFTSRMAYNSEIIAIISSGISSRRLLFPYFIGALIIASFSFVLQNYVLPYTNTKKVDFENRYEINQGKRANAGKDLHKQIAPGVFVYFYNYRENSARANYFSLEKIEDGKLVSKLMAQNISWDTAINKWQINNYYIREINGLDETIIHGKRLDTALAIVPDDLKTKKDMETMNLRELNQFVDEMDQQGDMNLVSFQIEKYRRFSIPFSTFILTLIGLSVSMRKMRGGMGGQLGFGVAVSFVFILFERFSSQFAIGAGLNPFIAVWIPNIIFAVVAAYLYKIAPK